MSDQVHVDIPLALQDSLIGEDDLPFSVMVTYDGQSRLFEIKETHLIGESPAYRNFTIDGGIPPVMMDDNVVSAISKKIGLHTQAIVNIV